MPIPFVNDRTGGICCDSKILPCPSCRAKLAAESKAALRAGSSAPPDPYAAAIQQLRDRDAHRERVPSTPVPRHEVTPRADFTPPDAYAADLARMRTEQR